MTKSTALPFRQRHWGQGHNSNPNRSSQQKGNYKVSRAMGKGKHMHFFPRQKKNPSTGITHKTTQMSTDRWVDKQYMAYTYNGILFSFKKNEILPWLVWLTGLSASLPTKESRVWFLVWAQAWAAGQVPSRGHMRGNHALMFSFSLPSPLSKNK